MPEPPTNYSPLWESDTRAELPLVGDERTVLTAYLDWHRETFALNCAGVRPSGCPRRPCRRRTSPGTGWPATWQRRVLVHMIAEYARHDGHADLLRERIDGRTGQ